MRRLVFITTLLIALISSACLAVARIHAWFSSGAAPASLFISHDLWRAPSIRCWMWLIFVNSAYFTVSSSTLLRGIFSIVCWPILLVVALRRYSSAGSLARYSLRRLYRDLLFARDIVAWREVPMLVLDGKYPGWIAMAGITFSFYTFTVEIHSLRLTVKRIENRHISMHVQNVKLRLFRDISIGTAHVLLEGGDITPFKIEHRREIMRAIPNDGEADEQYAKWKKHIFAVDCIAECRRAATPNSNAQSDTTENSPPHVGIDKLLRQRSQIPPATETANTLTKLQDLIPRRLVRVILHAPLVVRWVLLLCSHCHPIHSSSICVGVSGSQLQTEMSGTMLFRETEDEEVAHLQKEVGDWLSSGVFNALFTDIYCMIRVPFRAEFDITMLLQAQRTYVTRLQENCTTDIGRLSMLKFGLGMSSYILPGQKHLVVESSLTNPQNQGTETMKLVDQGKVDVNMSIHSSLPVTLDNNLTRMIGQLVKVSKILELEDGSKDEDDDNQNALRSNMKRVSSKMQEKAQKGMERVLGNQADADRVLHLVDKLAEWLESAEGDFGYTRTVTMRIPSYAI